MTEWKVRDSELRIFIATKESGHGEGVKER